MTNDISFFKGFCTFDGLNVYSVAYYNDYISVIYKDYKYRKNSCHLNLFNRMILQSGLSFDFDNAFILPLSKSYHVVNLVRLFSNFLKIPNIYCFEYIRPVSRQCCFDRIGRRANVNNSLRLNVKLPKDCYYILFDDVCTTGATLLSMRQPLLQYGINYDNIIALTFLIPDINIA